MWVGVLLALLSGPSGGAVAQNRAVETLRQCIAGELQLADLDIVFTLDYEGKSNALEGPINTDELSRSREVHYSIQDACHFRLMLVGEKGEVIRTILADGHWIDTGDGAVWSYAFYEKKDSLFLVDERLCTRFRTLIWPLRLLNEHLYPLSEGSPIAFEALIHTGSIQEAQRPNDGGDKAGEYTIRWQTFAPGKPPTKLCAFWRLESTGSCHVLHRWGERDNEAWGSDIQYDWGPSDGGFHVAAGCRRVTDAPEGAATVTTAILEIGGLSGSLPEVTQKDAQEVFTSPERTPLHSPAELCQKPWYRLARSPLYPAIKYMDWVAEGNVWAVLGLAVASAVVVSLIGVLFLRLFNRTF